MILTLFTSFEPELQQTAQEPEVLGLPWWGWPSGWGRSGVHSGLSVLLGPEGQLWGPQAEPHV